MESKRNAAVNTCLDLLFRNGQGHKAERLVLTSGEGQDLGGWRRLSMRHYLRYLFDAGAASVSRKEVVREPCPAAVPPPCEECGHPEAAHMTGELKCWVGLKCPCTGYRPEPKCDDGCGHARSYHIVSATLEGYCSVADCACTKFDNFAIEYGDKE